jgi:hypothetical protein
MFISCLAPFHEDIHGTTVTFHKSTWQVRVSIQPATINITDFWVEIPVASMIGMNVLVQSHATFNPLFYLEDGSNRFIK